MSERGRFASVVYIDIDTEKLKYAYAYYSTHEDIYPEPEGAVLNGKQDPVALLQEKDDILFLSSYQLGTEDE